MGGNSCKTKICLNNINLNGDPLEDTLRHYQKAFRETKERKYKNYNKTCYKCKKKGHIAKECDQYNCKICNGKHNEKDCFVRGEYIINQILKKLNNSFNNNISYIEHKLKVLKDEKNRRQRELANIEKAKELERKDKIKGYNKTNRINKTDDIMYKSRVENNRYEKYRQSLINTITITRKINKTIEVEGEGAKASAAAIAKIEQIEEEFREQIIKEYNNNNQQVEVKKKTNNKDTIRDIKIKPKKTFFGNKPYLEVEFLLINDYIISIMPTSEKIVASMKNNDYDKGKVVIGRPHSMRYNKKTNYITNIKRQIEKVKKVDTLLDKLSNLYDLDLAIENKGMIIQNLNEEYNELRNKIKEQEIENQQKKKNIIRRTKKLIDQDAEIIKKNNEINNLKIKMNDMKAYVQAKVKEQLKDEIANMRKSSTLSILEERNKLKQQVVELSKEYNVYRDYQRAQDKLDNYWFNHDDTPSTDSESSTLIEEHERAERKVKELRRKKFYEKRLNNGK